MPISSLAQTQQVIQNLLALQTKGNTLEQQISTGLKSQSFAGIAPQAAQVVSLNATQSQQQGFIDTINTVGTRLQTMSLATSTIASLVQQFGTELQTNAYNTTGTTVQSQAQALLADVGDYLNSTDGEGYIFSGSASATAPFVQGGLPSPGDLVTSVSGAPPAGYYAGNDDISQAQVDTNLSVQYGITADNPAFEQAIRALNFIANAPPFSSNNPADVANVNQAQTMLNNAGTQIQQLTAQVGMQQSELNNTLQVHQQSLSLAKSSIGDIENVDPATAITQLDTLQTQMEASYQTVNILQNLTLANYLK
ncbi:MAG TPA: flagellin [Stellaceae bacterium]|nr:flagellin [Stellaceae bacterium]